MEPQTITAEEVGRRQDAGEAIVFLDSRSEEAWRKSEVQIPKSQRVPPGDVEAHLDKIPRQGLIVPYCTCPHEESSLRVARTLDEHGWTNVRPLVGGLEAWRRAGCPLEAKPTRKQTQQEVAENISKAEGDEAAAE